MTNPLLTLENIRSGAVPSDAVAVGFLLGEIDKLRGALQTILDFSDLAMGDGDGARDVARAALGVQRMSDAKAADCLATLGFCATAVQEIIRPVEGASSEPSDGPRCAFLEMPEGYSGPVKISNPGAPVAEVTVYKGAPEPRAVDPNGPPHELRPLLENAVKALDMGVAISPGSYVHDELKLLLSQGASRSLSASEAASFHKTLARSPRVVDPASLVGALQDVVHTDPGPVRAGHAVRSSQARFCDYRGPLVERDGKMVCPECGNS